MTEQVEKKVKKTLNLKYERDKDREKVKGIFRFYEVPGGTLQFPFRKYKEDEVENFSFVDGQVYTIPLGVAKHLNHNGWYPQYEYIPGMPGAQDVKGIGGMRVCKKVRRFGFQSLEFVDIEDFAQHDKQIVEVEFADKTVK